MANQRINFTVGFNVDQSGLNALRASLSSLEKTQLGDFNTSSLSEARTKLDNIKTTTGQIKTALAESFNQKLNTYNIQEFQKSLANSGLTLQSIKTQFLEAGTQGQIAFRNLANTITATKLPLQESHNLLRSMGNTLANTLKWSIASTAINTVVSSVQTAWQYTQELDKSLNNIMLVTEKSADQMSNFAVQANKAAKALGSTTTDYTNAALIYYQQGLDDAAVKARTETTLKTANVTKQSTDAVSEQLTAVWNGYKVSAAESELYIDKLAAVAASTASDLEELSTGMSKVASAANNMGVDIDQLNGLLATAISVTRQAPETVGTAFKTIFARITDIEAGLDEDTTLGEYTERMAQLGVSVLDSNNKLRNMGEVIEEIGEKWKTMSREQQVALAQTMAGTRQYNNLLAVFENWDMYQKAVDTSANSVGFLQQQNEEYLTSIEAHLNQLETAGQRVYKALFDPKDANGLIDVLTDIVDLFGSFVESIGGGKTLLMALIPLLTRAFSGTIAGGLATFVTNMGNANNKAQVLKNTLNTINNIDTHGLDEYTTELLELKKSLAELAQQGILTNEEFNNLTNSLNTYAAQADKVQQTEKKLNTTQSRYSQVLAAVGKESALTNANWQETKDFGNDVFQGNEQAEDFSTTKTSEIMNNELSESSTLLDGIIQKYKAIYKEAQKVTEINKTSGKLTEEEKQQVNNLNNQYKELEASLNNLTKAYPNDVTAKGLKNTMKEITSASGSMNKGANEAKRFANAIQQAAGQGETLGKKVKGAMGEVSTDINRIASGEVPKLKAALEDTGNSIKTMLPKKTLEAQIQNFTNLASQAAMAASAISMIINLGDIFSNEDLSTGEKLLQIVQNLGFALPMLAPTVMMLYTLIKNMSLASVKKAAMEKLNLELLKAQNNEETQRLFWQGLINQLSEEELKNLKEEITLQKILNKELDDETLERLKQAAIEKQTQGQGIKAKTSNFGKGFKEAWKEGAWKGTKGAAASGSAKAAGTGATAATSGATSAGAAVAAALPYVALIAVIVAAIAGGFAISKSIAEEEEKALKKATEAAKHQQEVLAQTTQEWENLKNSIDNLESAEANLENLTKETVEWKKAIADINAEVLALISKYPELSREVEKTADGMLKLSEAGLQTVQDKQFKELQQAQAMSYMSNKMQRDAEYEVLKEDYVEAKQGAFVSGAGEYGAGVGAVGGTVVGTAAAMAIAGSVIPGLGTLLGAAIGAVTGLVVGVVSQAVADAEEDRQMAAIDTDKDIQAVFKLYASGMADGMFDSVTAFEKALKEHGIPINENTKALIDNAKETKALAEAYKTKTVNDHYEAIEIGKQVLGEGYSDIEYREIGEKTLQNAENSYEDIVNELKGGNKADRKAVEEYLKGLGIDPTTAEIGVKGSNKFQYTYNEKTYDLDIETAYRGIASQRAIEKAKKEQVNSDAIKMLTLKAGSTEAADALAQLYLGTADFSKISKQTFETLKNLVKEEKLFNSISEDAYKLFTKGVDEMNTAYASLWTNIEAQRHFNTYNIDLDNLNLNQQQVFIKKYQELYKYYGEDTVAVLAQVLQEAGSKATKLITAITTDIDWTTVTDPIQTALDLLEKEEVDITGDLKIAFGDLGHILAGIPLSLEELQNRFSSVQDIIEDIGKDSVLAKDKYEKLTDQQKKYFELLADGTALLLQDAIAFEVQARKDAQDAARKEIEIKKGITKQKKEDESTAKTNLSTERDKISKAEEELEKINTFEYQDKKIQEAYAVKQNYASAVINDAFSIDIAAIDEMSGVRQFKVPLNEENYQKYIQMRDDVLASYSTEELEILGLSYLLTDKYAGVGEKIQGFRTINRDLLEGVTAAGYGLANNNKQSIVDMFDLDLDISNEIATQTFNKNTAWSNVHKEGGLADIYSNAQKETEKAIKDELEAILQYARTFSYSELTNIIETDEYLKQLSPEQKNNLLLSKRKELVAEELIPNLNVDALDDALALTGESFEELIQTFAKGTRVLDETLERHEKALNKLTDEYDELTTAAKIDNVREQQLALNEVADATRKQYRVTRQQQELVGKANLRNIAQNVSQVTGESLNIDYSALFTSQGVDLDELKKIEDYYYNNIDTIVTNDALNNEFQELFKFFDEYDQKFDEFQEKSAEQIKQKLALQLEEFELKFQVQLDTEQFIKDINKFWRDFEDMGAITFAESLSSSLSSTMNSFNIELTKFNELSNQNFTLSQMILKQEESLAALQENALTQKQEIAELEEFINSIYETRIEYQQHVIDLTEKQIALNKLINGENNYNSYAGLMEENREAYAEAAQYAKEAAIAARKEVINFTGDKTSEAYKELVQKSIDATQAWGDAIEAETQYMVDIYNTSLDSIFGAIEEAVTGVNREEWARQTEWASSTDERWLDDIEAIYQLNDLERQYDKAIENATGAQKKALEARKTAEMAILKQKKEQGVLQEKDVERSQKVLELEQARMALEDARNNKTKMRLTRGADGTYGYSYVADTDAVSEAEAKIESLQEDLYTFDKERYTGVLDEIADLWAEYAEKRKELGADGDLSDEDVAILAQYTTEIEKLATASGTIFTNLKQDIRDAYGAGLSDEAVAELINSNIAMASTGIATFANTILTSGIDGVLADYQENLDDETRKISDYFNAVSEEMDQTKDGSFAAHLKSVKTLAQGVVDAFDKLTSSRALSELQGTLDSMKKSFDKVASAIEACIRQLTLFKTMQSSTVHEVKALAEAAGLNTGQTVVAWAKENMEGLDENSSTAEVMVALSKENIDWSTETSRDADTNAWITYIDGMFNFPRDKQNNEYYWGETRYNDLMEAVNMMPKTATAQGYLKNIIGENIFKDLKNRGKIPSLDTGGYTGEWDSSGRLAILHEKELVLNKEDTKNILESVSIVRSIASALEGLSNNRIVQMMSGFETSMAAWDVAKEMIIEQKVDITAEFPNATDKDEIMEAFDNLINLASQHAYKTTR